MESGRGIFTVPWPLNQRSVKEFFLVWAVLVLVGEDFHITNQSFEVLTLAACVVAGLPQFARARLASRATTRSLTACFIVSSRATVNRVTRGTMAASEALT